MNAKGYYLELNDIEEPVQNIPTDPAHHWFNSLDLTSMKEDDKFEKELYK